MEFVVFVYVIVTYNGYKILGKSYTILSISPKNPTDL